MWIWIVFLFLIIQYMLDAILILLTHHGCLLVFMALLKEKTNLHFGILFCIKETISMGLGCVLVILT